MATVYLAADLRHDRKVAIKVLKPELAAVLGADRFVVEIKTTAAMSHPHILPLFDSGEADGFLFYVMPYVEGETIREKLNRETQCGVDEAVRIAREVADALDYAHRHGVIHRDIKPENILLHDGRAMVMDFGIALAVSAAAGGRMTETGLSLGTPHYMSPEQATADKAITGRSDIYSLASVLYEMLTGEPPHMGTSAQQIIMKIIAEPVRPASELRRAIPPNVAAALAKALEKLPADRFESARAFGEALASPAFATSTGWVSSNVIGTRGWFAGWRVTAALLATGALLGWLARPSPPDPVGQVARVTVPLSEGYVMGDGIDPALAMSRDGSTLAYIANDALYKRSLDRDVTERLGDTPPRACCPIFSSDGRWILFSIGSDSLTAAMPVDGGAVVDARRVVNEDLVFGTYRQAISRRPAGDSTWHTIISSDSSGQEGGIGWPQLLPDGRTVLFTRFGPDMMVNGASVVALDLKTGMRTTVAERATYGRYSNTGHVVYATADGALEAVAFDLKRRQVSGSPVVVAEGVRVAYWGGAADYAISESGTLAYVRGSTWALHQMVGLDRAGRVVQRIGKPGTFEDLSLSPDGREVVAYVASNTADISRMNLITGELRRLTFEPTTEDNPVYSPDGRRIAYRKAVAARDQRIYSQAVDGSGEPTLLHREEEQFVVPRAWAPDGKTLALWASPSRLMLVDTERKRIDTVSMRASREGGKFSPDGRWLVWVSEETGESEIYVASFPGLRGRQQVSIHGGRFPQWSARSGELFFLAGDTLMVARVTTGASFAHTPPQPLFVTPPGTMSLNGFVVSADGQRIYYAAPSPDAVAHEIRIVFNLAGVLKAKPPR